LHPFSMVNQYHRPQFFLYFAILLLSIWLLSACSSTTPGLTPTQTGLPIQETNAPPTETAIEPAQESTPIITQSKVVFVSAQDADPVLSQQVSTTLSELAETEGLEFEQRTTFSPQEATAEIKLLAAIPPDPGLTPLADSAPATQFLGIAIPGLEPAANLTVIDSRQTSPDIAGFLAGYLAAVASPDWRVGVISTSDNPQGIAQRKGFLNGAVFFCGLCRQIYPPFITYPMYVEAPQNSSPQEWLSLADSLINSAVNTAYIPPGVGDESLLEYLAEAEVNIISSTSPPPGFKDRWIAIISADYPSVIRSAWPDLMDGQGGAVLPAPLTFSDPNYNLFSPGRQHLVEKMLADLTAGYIDTGVVE
jgi:hypothetical protein